MLKICHLYPDLMNLYGDRGNVICLCRRAQWRGIRPEVTWVSLGTNLDFAQFDLIFMGGGQDREQLSVCQDFQRVKGSSLREAVEAGVVCLAICGGYQLMGHSYSTHDGKTLPGIGVMDVVTQAGKKRLIGNVVVESDLTGGTLVGFENHSGKTYLGPSVKPLGRVVQGYGNNGEDGCEGALYRGLVGTYLHGSLLPKNPRLADYLIESALRRRDPAFCLEPLDDTIEMVAHQAAVKRAKAR
ncbi:MAG: glutamine amidotransferase [Bacillota bacterium]